MKTLLAITALAALAAGAHAQDFPGSKPISIVVPFAAGGRPTGSRATSRRPCASPWAAAAS